MSKWKLDRYILLLPITPTQHWKSFFYPGLPGGKCKILMLMNRCISVNLGAFTLTRQVFLGKMGQFLNMGYN